MPARSNWIPLYCSLPDDPKTIATAKALEVRIPVLVGHLACLWMWVATYFPDGVIPESQGSETGETPELLRSVEAGARWKGRGGQFFAALTRFGWIEIDPVSGICKCHNWQHYAGKLEDKRRADVRRKSAGRPTDVQRKSDGVPLEVAGRGEERRIEEKREPPPTPHTQARTEYRDKHRDGQARPWLRPRGGVQTVGFDPAKTETHGDGGVTWTPEDLKKIPFRAGAEETERLRQAAKERLEVADKPNEPEPEELT